MRGSPINRLEPLWPRALADKANVGERTTWGDSAKSWEKSLESLMADHAKLALAAAAVAGLLLGWMVKRK